MQPPDEIVTLQGEARKSSRPLTPEEQRQLQDHVAKVARSGFWGGVGCIASPFLFIGSLVALGSLPRSTPVIVFWMIGSFGGLAWLLLSAQEAIRRAKFARRDAKARNIELYEIEGQEVEALDSGRIIRKGNEKAEGEYGVRRVVGLPHSIIQDDRTLGQRRLSAAELEEIDRLIQFARMKVGYLEVFVYFFATFTTAALAFEAFSGRWDFPTLAIPALSYIALASKVWQRRSFARVRAVLREGKRSGRVVAAVVNGRHVEVLASKIVWSVDGRPSPVRTKWAP